MGRRNGETQRLCWVSGVMYLSLLLLSVLHAVTGDALISSLLLNCSSGEDDNLADDLQCVKKMLLQMSLLSAKTGESDTVETYITSVLDNEGESRDLEEPYRVTVYKSDVYAQFPLEYIQSFDGFPHEVELLAPNCRDGSLEENPNCGWALRPAENCEIPKLLSCSVVRLYNKGGKRLEDSQGFCCSCTLRDRLPLWLGGGSLSTRSKQDCNDSLSSFLNLLHVTRRGSAHCLRHSTQWYPTYRIGVHNQTFTIRVMAQPVYTSVEALDLGKIYAEVTPHQRVHLNSERTMKGQLVIHSVLNGGPPLLTDRYLSVPYQEESCEIIANASKWLALPSEFYTLDGSECNKIGVSYSAFRSQDRPCSQVFQSCVGNQLHNYVKDETERMANGEKPQYVLSAYGKTYINFQRHNSILNIHTNQSVTSLISLELEADDVKFFVHRSPGKILQASILLSTDGQSDGLLKVEILNVGKIAANFTLHTEECPLQLSRSTVEVRSLTPGNAVGSFTFRLTSTDNISYGTTCRVVLEDSMGDVTDVFEVRFKPSSREELVYVWEEFRYFLRAETAGTGNFGQWFWNLFNWTRWTGGFGTGFCLLWCPNSTIEAGQNWGGHTVYRCAYGGQTSTSPDLKCPAAPKNATGILSIFNWTPCGECLNIIRDFGCYVTTFCWNEILTFIAYLAVVFFVLYFLWLLYLAGFLEPLVEKLVALIALACKCISSGLTRLLTRLLGGEKSSTDDDESQESDESDDDDSDSYGSDSSGYDGRRSRHRRSQESDESDDDDSDSYGSDSSGYDGRRSRHRRSHDIEDNGGRRSRHKESRLEGWEEEEKR